MSPLNHSSFTDKYAWMSKANCIRPKNRHLYRELEGFDGASISKRALELCETCPVRAACLRHAYEHKMDFGYYGGLAPSKRRELGTADAAIAWLREQGRLPEEG